MAIVSRTVIPLAWLLLAVARGTTAETPVILSEPDIDVGLRGTVYASVTLSDRSVVIGGAFDEVHDPATGLRHPRNGLARILPNGTLDPDWNPEVLGYVRALARDASDRVYVGGGFNFVDGLQRGNIARVDGGTGVVDPDWNPFSDQPVLTLHVDDASGSVFAGGDFSAIGGLLRSRLARLSMSGWGAGVGEFSVTPNETVWILEGRGGFIYAGGDFTAINGTPRNYLAKISVDGSLDGTWNPSPSHEVYALDIAVDNASLYVGGRFNQIGGQSRSFVARVGLAGAGVVDAQWNPSPNSTVFSIAESPFGWTYLAGAFTHAGGSYVGYGARVLAGGLVDGTWQAGFDDFALTVTFAEFDRLIFGGQFSGSNGRPASAVVQFQTFNTSFGSFPGAESLGGGIHALAPLPDGSVIVAGGFTRVTQGSQRFHRKQAFKLDAANRVDPTWHAGADYAIYSAVADASGQVYLGGYFTRIGSTGRSGLARVSGTGTGAVDATWNPGANNAITAMMLDGSGKLVVGGLFTQLGGLPLARLARVSTTGAGIPDAGWAGNVDGEVSDLARDSLGRIYASGWFQQVGGQSIRHLARIDPVTGAPDIAWRPNPDGVAPAISAAGGTAAYAGAYFVNMPGMPPLQRFQESGAIDPTFLPVVASPAVSALARATDGSLHVAGTEWQRFPDLSSGIPDPDWQVSANDFIDAIVQRADGTWLAAGRFTAIQGQPRRQLVAVAPATVFANGFE